MTDTRAQRITVLTNAAKAKSQAKTEAAEQAIRALTNRGKPITFQAVQREAGVSHAFLYNHPDLRSRIERLRTQARPTAAPADTTGSDDTLVLGRSTLKWTHRSTPVWLHLGLAAVGW